MMLPSPLDGLPEELAAAPLRSAIELSTNDEMIDSADAALVEDEALELLLVSALIRL
jgi:hypothetical protein